jgi:diguanylate cyclase (GGDEF)-like protein/PAS domain S-box-containing protein
MSALELRDLGIGLLFWSMREAAIVGDVADGRIKFWNPAATQLFGYSESEAIGMPIARLVPESSRAALRTVLAGDRAIGHGRPVEGQAAIELPALRNDGEVITIELTLSPLAQAREGHDYVVALIRDVSDRARALAALQQSEAMYASLVETIPLSLFRKDREGRFTFANRRFCASLGKSLEEIVGRTDFDFYPPALAEKYRADDRRVLETGQLFDAVEEHLAAGRELQYVHVMKAPTYDAQGAIGGTQCLFWDVTEFRRAELALQQSEARFAAFMDNGIAEVFVKDAEGRYEYVNRQFASHFGVTQDGICGKTDAELWPPEMARQVREHDLTVLAQDRAVETLETHAPADGPRQHWSVHKFPFRDAAGRRLLGGMAIDVSDQVRQRERREALLRVARELAAETDTGRILDTILAEAIALLGGSAATVYRWDPTLGVLSAMRVVGDAGAIAPTRPGEGATGRAFAQRATVIVNDYARGGAGMTSWVATGVQAAMSAPLLHEGRLLGTLSVASRTAGARFGSEDAELLEVLAGIAATVLVGAERAELLRGLAETDSLTGLANRRKAGTVLEHFLGLCHRHGHTLAFAILDLDHFKRVNDQLGHAAGDEVLRRVAHLLQQSFRGEDVVARWGGEEFAVAMYASTQVDGARRLAVVLDTLRRERFQAAGEAFEVTFSAGVAEYPSNAANAEALYRVADEALYKAKEAGRARIVVAETA